MKIACPHCSQHLELDPETLIALEGASHFNCPTCGGAVEVPAPVLVPTKRAAPGQEGKPAPERVARLTQQGMNRNLLVLGVVALLAIGGVAMFLASKSGGSIFHIFQNTTNQIINNSYFTQLIADGVTTKDDLESIAEIRPYGEGFIGITQEPLAWESALDLSKRAGSSVLSVEDSAEGSKHDLVEWLNDALGSQMGSTLWVRQKGQAKVLDKREVLDATALDSQRKVLLHWIPKAGGMPSEPARATMERPFENSLGMKFVPVPITSGPTSGKKVLFSVWETRVQDYAVFVAETRHEWVKPDFAQGPLHPVVNVSWNEAQAFCSWLSEREIKAGRLSSKDRYRLPSDHEWSCAAGLGDREDPAKQPSDKSEKISGEFPWGSEWPPPSGTGNYAGEELQAKVSANAYPFIRGVLPGYRDEFLETAPVGSFPADGRGLYDLSGNAREWCEDWWDSSKQERVLRGGSWGNEMQVRLLSSHRDRFGPSRRYIAYGFRVVLEVSAPENHGWTSLFPNDSLAGWTGDVAGYRLANGILTSPDNFGDLISPKEYGSFHLKFDLRLSSGANNGIGVWCAKDKGPHKYVAHTGFEIQIIDDASPTFTRSKDWHLHGALSGFIVPSAKPMGAVGTWNSHEIRMEGTRLTILINDVTVIDQELPTGDPVSPRAFRSHRLDLTKRRGHLVFCGMKGPVDFRNVMIKELP